MKRDEIIRTSKEPEANSRAYGVTPAALFGSVVLGQQRPDSDILVDFDPAAVATIFDCAGLKGYGVPQTCPPSIIPLRKSRRKTI
jgi:predicted nucleotidyltransferase